MNTASFKKKLLKELKKSPKKAAALGLLAVVALYMWTPLLLGDSEEELVRTAPGNPATANTQSPASPPADSQPQEAMPHRPNWRELAAWIESDPRMTPAALTNLARSPFYVPTKVVEEPSAEAGHVAPPRATPAKAEITPQSLGLELSGTIVGGGRRVALINGRAYAEGRTIQCGQIEFRVARVTPRQVHLEHQGKQFALQLTDAAATEGDSAPPAIEVSRTN